MHKELNNNLISTRIDKWLWAARFYKTRSLATEEVGKGRVLINDATIKPAREVKIGDRVAVRQGPVTRTVMVQAIADKRGSAPTAQLLYAETAESTAAREHAAEQRRLSPEPALAINQGRPTKRDRRLLTQETTAGAWNTRWSASVDD